MGSCSIQKCALRLAFVLFSCMVLVCNTGLPFNAAPQPPQKVTVDIVKTTSILLSWSPLKNCVSSCIRSYTLEYRKHHEESFRVANTVAANQTSGWITNLNTSTLYEVVVASHNLFGSGRSFPIKIKTLDGPTKSPNSVVPLPPRNVTVDIVKSTSILLSWKPPNNFTVFSIRSYTLEYRQHSNESFKVSNTVGANQTNGWIKNLNTGTLYEVVVASHNLFGSGRSFPIKIRSSHGPTTPPYSVVPPPPQDVTVDIVMSTSLMLSWKPPKNFTAFCITRYTLEYRQNRTGSFKAVSTVDANQTSGWIKNLNTSTLYEVVVASHNLYGSGRSFPKRIRTLGVPTVPPTGPVVPLPPRNVTVDDVKSTSILLSWKPPKNFTLFCIRNYTLEYRQNNNSNGSFTVSNTVDANQTSGWIINLNTGTFYEVVVTSNNPFGSGRSSPIKIRTLDAPTILPSVSPLALLWLTSLLVIVVGVSFVAYAYVRSQRRLGFATSVPPLLEEESFLQVLPVPKEKAIHTKLQSFANTDLTDTISEAFINETGGTIAIRNVSLRVAPTSIESPTNFKVTLEDPLEHYQPFLRTELTNNVVFGASVIKLEPHGCTFEIPAKLRVTLDKQKGEYENIVVLHGTIGERGKIRWDDITEASVYSETNHAVEVELAHFSLIEILFVRPWIQVKHVISKLNLCSIDYTIDVFVKDDEQYPRFSDLALVFMSKDVYLLEAYREHNDCAIKKLQNEGFKELRVEEICESSIGEKIVYNTESLDVTIDLGNDFKLAPGQNAHRKITVDSSVWRNAGHVVRYKLESNEDVRMISGKVTVEGDLGRSVVVTFHEEDLTTYVKNIISLEKTANLLPVARQLAIPDERLWEVLLAWHSDIEQIFSILEIWKEENGNVDPCTIKELLKDLSPEDYHVNEMGKLHVQHLRDLAFKIFCIGIEDPDLNRFLWKKTQCLFMSILRDACIEMSSVEQELERCLSSEQYLSFVAQKKQLPNDLERHFRQFFTESGTCRFLQRRVAEIIANFIQLVKEMFTVEAKVESQQTLNGLWGLHKEVLQQSTEIVWSSLEDDSSSGVIVGEMCSVLERLCLKNSNGRSSEQIHKWGECLAILDLLSIIEPFLKTKIGSKLKKRVESVAVFVRRIVKNPCVVDDETVQYFARITLTLIKFAAFSPAKLVQFEVNHLLCTSICKKLTLIYDSDQEVFSQTFEVEKGTEDEVELEATALVQIHRTKPIKVGAFKTEFLLKQEEKEKLEELQQKSRDLSITIKVKVEQPNKIRVTLFSKRKKKLESVSESRVEISHCPLPICSSAEHEKVLMFTLL